MKLLMNFLMKSLRSKYQDNLKTSMKGSDFIFNSAQLMYYKCHKVNFKRGGSDIDSSNWLENKKATTNRKNEDDKCFQYAETIAINYEEIKCNLERILNIKPFINKYNWVEMNYPSKIDDWKTFEKINLRIALNILYIKEKQILPGYISKHTSTCEKQIILLMIPNKEKRDGIVLQ